MGRTKQHLGANAVVRQERISTRRAIALSRSLLTLWGDSWNCGGGGGGGGGIVLLCVIISCAAPHLECCTWLTRGAEYGSGWLLHVPPPVVRPSASLDRSSFGGAGPR